MKVERFDQVTMTSIEDVNALWIDNQHVAEFEHRLFGGGADLSVGLIDGFNRKVAGLEAQEQKLTKAVLDAGDTPGELLAAQIGLVRLTGEVELAAKLMGKVTQSLETLTKIQ